MDNPLQVSRRVSNHTPPADGSEGSYGTKPQKRIGLSLPFVLEIPLSEIAQPASKMRFDLTPV
jgi:hypothetical protein